MKFKNLIVIIAIILATSVSCKKDANSMVSIVGKWFITKQASELLYNGVLVSTFTKTSFTPNDFTQYFSDGTGYFSQNTATSPSLIEFTYTLKGDALNLYTSTDNTATPETVVSLTTGNLSIHAESLVPDPNNPGQLDNEIDNYTYIKSE
jgi:hypothetical protein